MNSEFTVYHQRRQRLLAEMETNSLFILSAGYELFRNSDCAYPFRQQSDFYYLTGFTEPDAILVLMREEGAQRTILLNHPHDAEKAIWDGARVGQQAACEQYGFDEAYSLEVVEEKLCELLSGVNHLYRIFSDETTLESLLQTCLTRLRKQVRRGVQTPHLFVDAEDLLHEMRLVKDEHEIALMRRAAEISVQAHEQAMRRVAPGVNEAVIEAELHYQFMQAGARFPAYTSIVAGGGNACTLHYTANDQVLQAGDLVLIDAGGEYQYYASDITRTFPVNGRFSAAQRQLYEIVLAAQMAAIEMIRPGVTFDALQQRATQVITEGLVSLGILQGALPSLLEDKAYAPFYMHNIGHWLGLDTHDVGAYKIKQDWRVLQPGFVLTVEPGIYISPTHPGVDEQWRGIGIRIEDDVLVTEQGADVLTGALPKTVDELEAFLNVK